jgi:predicted RNA-binding protein Jag
LGASDERSDTNAFAANIQWVAPMSDGSAQRPARNSHSSAKSSHSNDRAHGAPSADRQDGSPGGVADPGLALEELLPRLKAFLDLVAGEMALVIQYDISTTSESESDDRGRAQEDGSEKRRAAHGETGLLVRFGGDDEEILLARNGELLLALEYLAHRWLRLPPALHDGVRFECGDFRAHRLEELKLSARVAAQRVRETGQPFPFNPMSSRDRRTIHLELNGAAGVRTTSEGSGDHRHLVIYPASPPSRK